MRGKTLLLLISFSLLFSFSLPAWSEDKDKEAESTAYDLGEVLVTGGKAPTSMDKTAITTEITAEQIQATNSRTVAEALSHAAGVRVSTGMKNQPNISLHGFDQTRILVLIDGVPYYETKYHYLDLNQLPTDAVEKIVVTKGAASVLYGANAMGGVVNIITKKPVATPKPLVSATTEVGDGGYNREVFSSGWKKGIFSYWLSYTRDELPAWRLSDDFNPQLGTITWTGAQPYFQHLLVTIYLEPGYDSWQEQALLEDGGYRDNSYMKSNSIFAKFGIEPSPDSEYFANFFYITREKGIPLSIYDTHG